MTMPTRTRTDPQIDIFERNIDDQDLLAALEERERIKGIRTAVSAKFRAADEQAKGLVQALDLEPGDTVRCGRFKIAVRQTEGRSVAFDTEPTQRITISPVD